MSVVEQQASEMHVEQARQALAASVEAWEQHPDAPSPALVGAAAEPGEYVAIGTVSFTTAFIWGRVVAQLTFADGTAVRFDGEHWGAGFGGGISAGSAIFRIPVSELMGGGTYSATSLPGSLQVVFYKDHVPVGVFTGAALSVGPMVVGGSGTWNRA